MEVILSGQYRLALTSARFYNADAHTRIGVAAVSNNIGQTQSRPYTLYHQVLLPKTNLC
jgi:hypothetical protein